MVPRGLQGRPPRRFSRDERLARPRYRGARPRFCNRQPLFSCRKLVPSPSREPSRVKAFLPEDHTGATNGPVSARNRLGPAISEGQRCANRDARRSAHFRRGNSRASGSLAECTTARDSDCCAWAYLRTRPEAVIAARGRAAAPFPRLHFLGCPSLSPFTRDAVRWRTEEKPDQADSLGLDARAKLINRCFRMQ